MPPDQPVELPRPTAPQEGARSDEAELIDLAFDAIFTRGFRDRLIRFWSRGAEELYGWSATEARGIQPRDLLGSRYPIPVEEIEWQVLSTGRWEGEIDQRRRDGTDIVVASRWALRRNSNGDPTEILEINSDATQRKQAELELRRSEEKFRMLVAAVKDYAIFMLDPRGYVASWNDGAERIKGYHASEVIGKHFATFYPAEDVIAGKPTRALQRAKREGRFEEEGWRVRKDGSLFWAHVTLSAVRDEAGFLHGYAKVTRDLTEPMRQQQHLLDLERAEAARHREHAERMEALEQAKAEFLNLASHELRGPLAVISGYLSLFGEGALGQLNDLGTDVVPVMFAKTQEMNRLVDQMIDIARLEEGRIHLNSSVFDVREVLGEALETMTGRFSSAHSVSIDVPTTPVMIEADRDHVRTIVVNLLDNAMKYSPDGGEANVLVKSTAETVSVIVRDRGIGIEPRDLPKLFSRFGRIVTRENSHIPGSGLGLYLCRQLALRAGGDITASIRDGGGMEFTLTLPTYSVAGPERR